MKVKLIRYMTSTIKNVPHEFSLTTDVVFELKTSPKDLNNMYLYIDSKAAPLTDTYWKLDHLVSK